MFIYQIVCYCQDTEAAGNMLTTMDVFKAAASVKVDPDKPLQAARFATLKVSNDTDDLHFFNKNVSLVSLN